jgi:cation:H+ antiporter
MTLTLFAIISGLALLCAGAEFLIRGAVSLSLRIGISPLVVGLTVVALGTSSPEIVVGVKAAIDGHESLAIGSVVGSNIANIGLILAIGILVRPISIHVGLLRRDLPILLGITLLVPLTLINGMISRLEGFLLLVGAFVYLVFNIFQSRKEKNAEAETEYESELSPRRFSPLKTTALIAVGILGLVAGGRFLLMGGVDLATRLGVSEAVIGLTVVAFGTSLPELATAIAAARRGHGDIAVGNAVGSNIMNLLAVLGLAALVTPLFMSDVRLFDLAIMVGMTAVLLPLMRTDFSLRRIEGALLLAAYLTYIFYTALG